MNDELFNEDARAWVGRRIVSSPMPVTAVDIAKYAYAIGATDPAHFDREVAQHLGYPSLIAPLSYYLVFRHLAANLMPLNKLSADGAASDMTPPTSAMRKMAGGSSTTFHRRVFEGDVIVVEKSLTGLSEKQGRSGPLGFIAYAIRYLADDGSPVVEETYERIVR